MSAGRPLATVDEQTALETPRNSGIHEVQRITGDAPLVRRMRRFGRSPTRPALLVLRGQRLGELFVLSNNSAILGRASTATARLDDRSVSGEHARIWSEGNKLYLLDLASRNGTFVNGRRVIGRRRLRCGDYVNLGSNVTLKFCRIGELERRALQTLYELTLRDPLTRLYNRRYFHERLRSEFASSRRHGTGLGVLLLDIDHFKAVNDRHGHPAGDSVLRAVAEVLQSTLRPEDVVARYGGEEFVVLVREHRADELTRVAERLRLAVDRTIIRASDGDIHVQVSVGATCLQPLAECSGPSALIATADRALYGAKNAGRNRTCLLPIAEVTELRPGERRAATEAE